MIEILSEPVGLVYEALLALALQECSTFSLVTYPFVRFDASAEEMTERLAPHLVRQMSATSWPGSQIGDGTAIVRHYYLNGATGEALLSVPGLYSWLSPAYPEDLAFYGADGSVWLGSRAHDTFAFFEVVSYTRADLERLVPGLHIRERWSRGRTRRSPRINE